VVEIFLKRLIVWYIVILPTPGLYHENFRFLYLLNQRRLTWMIITAVWQCYDVLQNNVIHRSNECVVRRQNKTGNCQHKDVWETWGWSCFAFTL